MKTALQVYSLLTALALLTQSTRLLNLCTALKNSEFPARMHKSKNLRELSARWACKRIAIVPWHPFSGISLQFRGVAL